MGNLKKYLLLILFFWFSVVLSQAVKEGKHIYIQGPLSTLETVASDINDAAYCSWNATTKTLTVFGTAANNRFFRIRNNGVLTINAGETLQFSNATNDDTRFYVDAGGHLILNDDATIDGSVGNTRPYFWYFYGAVTCNANIPSDLRPTIKDFYRMYFYETTNNNAYPNDIWDFTGARIGGSRINNGYAFYMYVMGKIRNHIFKDMIFDERIDSNLDTYGFAFPYAGGGYENITLDNIQFDQVERGFNNTGGANIHVKNTTFGNSSNSWSALTYGSSNEIDRDFLRFYNYHNQVPYGQTFSFYDNCTFLSGNNANKMNIAYGANVLVRDTDFQRTSGDAVETKYGGRFMEWTGNTYSDGNPFDTQQGGERSQVFKLDIQVVDANALPIQNAKVSISQHDKKEQFTFTTNANGKLHAIHNLEGALLTYRSYYTNTAFETWSSATEPHSFKIQIDGYKKVEGTVVMNQDRTLVVKMKKTRTRFSRSNGVRYSN